MTICMSNRDCEKPIFAENESNVVRKTWQVDSPIAANPLAPEKRMLRDGCAGALDFLPKTHAQTGNSRFIRRPPRSLPKETPERRSSAGRNPPQAGEYLTGWNCLRLSCIQPFDTPRDFSFPGSFRAWLGFQLDTIQQPAGEFQALVWGEN